MEIALKFAFNLFITCKNPYCPAKRNFTNTTEGLVINKSSMQCGYKTKSDRENKTYKRKHHRA